MSEQSLWCYLGGICWKSGLRNLPFSRAPGKVVHEVVSHLKQCNKTVQRWGQSLCSWPLYRSLALEELGTLQEHGARSCLSYSNWTLGMCRRSLPSEHIKTRMQTPFPLQCPSSVSAYKVWRCTVDSGKYLKGPDPFSQSRQKERIWTWETVIYDRHWKGEEFMIGNLC